MLNHDVIERLLIDREMGELSDDAVALLDEFRRLNPAGRESADETVPIVRLARAALREDLPADARPLPMVSFARRTDRKRRAAWIGGGLLGFAAAAALALAVWTANRQGVFSLDSVAPLARTQDGDGTLVNSSARTRNEGAAGFWSVGEWRRSMNAGQAGAGADIEWINPVMRPRRGASS
ncbi:MAG TPA: hypothetical protein VNT79_11560 [Phycisphaerae bacterium]|nr:hypothetical protein [Phycisphaerae bacterium]